MLRMCLEGPELLASLNIQDTILHSQHWNTERLLVNQVGDQHLKLPCRISGQDKKQYPYPVLTSFPFVTNVDGETDLQFCSFLLTADADVSWNKVKFRYWVICWYHILKIWWHWKLQSGYSKLLNQWKNTKQHTILNYCL